MAVSCSFFLVYSAERIKKDRLEDTPVGIRCQVRYTLDNLPWAISRRMDRQIHRLQFMLDVRAKPKFWAHGRVKPGASDSLATNRRIDGLGTRIHQLHAAYVEAGAFPTSEDFILEIFGTKEAAQKSSFFEDYERYLAWCETRTSASFLYNQRLTLRRLREYAHRITYDAINRTWASDFTHWILNAGKDQRKRTEKTAMKHLKLMRMFLNYALKEGWTTATYFKQIAIVEKRDAFPTSLTPDEVQRLWSLTATDFPDMPKANAAKLLLSRDWFVLATQTALRYSDWDPERLRIVEAPSGGKNFQFVQQKPGLPLEVPISALADAVLARHRYKMPKPSVPSATLRHIADACKAAGIKKHITTHTARRTFATLQEAAGVPRSITMRITGHKTEKDYLKYIGITFEHNADLMRKANPDWFTKTA